MERFCKTCGGFVTGNVKFCPNCGASMANAVDLDKPNPSAPVTVSPAQPTQSAQPAQPAKPSQPTGRSVVGFQAPAPPPERAETPMTMGQWLGTIILCSCLGMVSLVLNIVWGFAARGVPEYKRNYCRAMLVFNIIFSIASTFMVILFAYIFLNTPQIKEIIAAEAANSLAS